MSSTTSSAPLLSWANLIDAGHFHTENPTMPILAEKLHKAFPGVEVVFSEKHQDVMRFY